MRTAEGDAWQVHGDLRAGAVEAHGLRLMASGLDHPQYNGADVTAEDAAIGVARSWYEEFGVPWGMRVPLEFDWPHGRWRFEQRLMGLARDAFVPAAPAGVEVADDFDAVALVDAMAFDTEGAGEWLAPQFGAPRYETALVRRGDEVVGTGYSVRSDGRAGACLYIAGVGVVPHWRGRGIGAAITSWLLERGFERGATLAHLHPDTDAAARLYARLGFVEVPGFNVFVNQ